MSRDEIIALAFVKYGPGVARQLFALFQKDEITVADWESIFALSEKSYEDYIKPSTPPA